LLAIVRLMPNGTITNPFSGVSPMPRCLILGSATMRKQKSPGENARTFLIGLFRHGFLDTQRLCFGRRLLPSDQ
jgi:hypothetical protein